MQTPRKEISAALFNLVKNAYPWKTCLPRMKLGDDLPANMQPAAFLVKPREVIGQDQSMGFGTPTYKLTYYILVLIRASATPEDTGTTAEDIMDDILDALDRMFLPYLGAPNTLGGIVTNCYLSGDVQIDTPVLFEQCAIWVPIAVEVGANCGTGLGPDGCPIVDPTKSTNTGWDLPVPSAPCNGINGVTPTKTTTNGALNAKRVAFEANPVWKK
jgi:hypothetical protein